MSLKIGDGVPGQTGRLDPGTSPSAVRDAGSQTAETTAAVLGCGVIGSSWIEAFLARGIRVRAWDPRPGFDAQLGPDVERYRGLLTVLQSPAEAALGASFIQENGPEDLETKRALLAAITPALHENAVVASSSSTLQPTAIQRGSTIAAQVLVGHPFNPPHILPLVEVVGGVDTSQAAITAAMIFYRSIGKHPIRLRRERPGHLANRLQAALWREAVDAVRSGQASVADVDAAVTLALGPRWALMGPFATFHLGGGTGGLAHFLDHLGPAFEALWDDAHRPQMTEELRKEILRGVSDTIGDRSRDELSQVRDRKLRAVLSIASDGDTPWSRP
jgi:carnitine 3-dehydrogenase